MTKKITLRADDGSADFQGLVQIPDPDAIQPKPLDAVNRKWADRARVEVGTEAPTGTDLYTGRLWYDTNQGVNGLKMWDGVQWVLIDGPEVPFGDGENGITLYVNSTIGSDVYVTGNYNDLVSPVITNQMVVAGYEELQPFKTLARAAIEVARITSGLGGFDPTYYDRVVIKVGPGDQIVENTPPIVGSTIAPWANGYVPDAEELRKFCHTLGGIVLSRGVSVQGEDLRKTIVRPNYVPPFGGDVTDDRSAIFRLTGGSYFFNITFKDKLGYDQTHHLLDCFSFTNLTELELFYSKVQTALSIDSPIQVINPGETQITAPQPEKPTLPTDGVLGSSPYIFNCSVRSIWGLCGIHADGNEATGFKSMVVAQFTGVSLQTDLRCWQYYNTSESPAIWSNFTSANTYEDLINADPNGVRQNPERISSHIRTRNEAVLQEVSVFAIGQGIHHWAESGSEITITNSNSNFGGVAALARGYKNQSFPVDSDWEVNRIRTATNLGEKTNNVKRYFLGTVADSTPNNATTITLSVPLLPGVNDPNVPFSLEREGYSLKENDYIWIVNNRGPDYRAVLAADPWTNANPNQIKVKQVFVNEEGTAPGDVAIPGNPSGTIPPILFPPLAGANIYIRRIKDTRTLAERRYSLLLANTSSFRVPVRDFVLQTDQEGGTGIQGPLPNTDLSVVASAVALIDNDSNSDAQIELRNSGGNTVWASATYYRAGDTVRYEEKHWNCLVDNNDLVFTPTKWTQSFVHMAPNFNQEGYYKNSKPEIIFNKDRSGIELSTTLGYNLSDSAAADYAWSSDLEVRGQLVTAVDYKGSRNFLVGLGFSGSNADIILLPRTFDDRDLNPAVPYAGIAAPDGAANDWANWGVELRRPTNIRLFGHAFEWAGFGNYTKGIPKYQKEITASNVFTYFFTNDIGGRVYASGFNEEGFIVTPRGLIDLSTGDEVAFDAIGANEDDNGFEFPTFFEQLEVNDLRVNNSLNLNTSTVDGNPTWTYEGDYIATADSIGPFGGVLPLLPQATEESQGVVKLATPTEANDLQDSTIAISPANLPIGAPGQQGLVSFATQAEANALTLDDVAIAPATLPISSTTQIGVVELATSAETRLGVRDDVAVTPSGLSATGIVPQGGIIMWSGAIASIPADWGLCDGTQNTPDLRSRFVVGAGTTYAPNATGGSADAIVVEHAHNVSSSGRLSLNDPGHNHGGLINDNGSGDDGPGSPNDADYQDFTNINTTGISISGGTEFEGSTGTNANLPPYYALAYIMRLI